MSQDRNIARAMVNQTSRAALATSANRRARVVSKASSGRFTVEYRGGEIDVPSADRAEYSAGSWVLLSYVGGLLQITGASAYGG